MRNGHSERENAKSIKAKLRIPPGRPSSQIHYMRVKPDICIDIDFPSPNGFGEAELQPTPDFGSIIFSGVLRVGADSRELPDMFQHIWETIG